jgi:hypothetical protein
MLLVYLITGALVGGVAWLAVYMLTQQFALLPLVAVLGPAVFLIDARLLGRISWLLNFRTPQRKARPRVKEQPPAEKPVAVEDPWAIPPDFEAPPEPDGNKPRKKKKIAGKKPLAADDLPAEEPNPELYPWEKIEEEPRKPDWDPEWDDRTPYGLLKDEVLPPPLPKRQAEETETLGLQPLPEEPKPAPDAKPEPHPLAHLTEVSEFEAALAGPPQVPDPPRFPLWSGVYQFPWYPTTLPRWGWLVFGSLAVLALLKLQLLFWLG